MEIKKKNHVLLEDEASNWRQNWTVASSLSIRGNKAFVFLANQSVFPSGHTCNTFHWILFRNSSCLTLLAITVFTVPTRTKELLYGL